MSSSGPSLRRSWRMCISTVRVRSDVATPHTRSSSSARENACPRWHSKKRQQAQLLGRKRHRLPVLAGAAGLQVQFDIFVPHHRQGLPAFCRAGGYPWRVLSPFFCAKHSLYWRHNRSLRRLCRRAARRAGGAASAFCSSIINFIYYKSTITERQYGRLLVTSVARGRRRCTIWAATASGAAQGEGLVAGGAGPQGEQGKVGHQRVRVQPAHAAAGRADQFWRRCTASRWTTWPASTSGRCCPSRGLTDAPAQPGCRPSWWSCKAPTPGAPAP